MKCENFQSTKQVQSLIRFGSIVWLAAIKKGQEKLINMNGEVMQFVPVMFSLHIISNYEALLLSNESSVALLISLINQ